MLRCIKLRVYENEFYILNPDRVRMKTELVRLDFSLISCFSLIFCETSTVFYDFYSILPTYFDTI